MQLYHFTTTPNAKLIVNTALMPGQIQTSPLTSVHGIWLTEDNTMGHPWFEHIPQRLNVCIAMDIDQWDEHLYSWSDFAEKHKIPSYLVKAFNKLSEGQHEKWWIYDDLITPDRFANIIGT